MKLSIMLAAVLGLTGFLTGCSSIPEHCNMTGNWKYTFEENGRSGIQNGTMTLAQNQYSLTGKCNDANGEFLLTGKLESTRVTLDGKRNDGKRNFNFQGKLTGENTFEGTYTTDQNTSGTINFVRLTGR